MESRPTRAQTSGNINHFTLQNVSWLSCPTIASTVLIHQLLWIHELKHERKQGNGCLASAENNASFCKTVLHSCYLRGSM